MHLFVSDLDRSLRFFTEQLGFNLLFDEVTENAGRFVAIAPPDGSAILGLSTAQPGSREYSYVGRSGNIVFVTDDIDAKYEEWRSRGVHFDQSPQTTGWRGTIANFTDPDGNPLVLMSQDEITRQLEIERMAAFERAEQERRAAREMEIAREFQSKLFPQTRSSLRTIDFAGRCIQARQVGGDYFDWLPLAERSFGLVIGDISGKGIGAH